MNGCRWAEKSFTVGGEEKNEYPCKVCGKPSNGYVMKHNGDVFCGEHFPKPKNPGIAEFNTPSDIFSNFVDTKNFGKPMHFSSLGAFEKECKKRGLHPMMRSDENKIINNPQLPNYKPTPHKVIKECIINELKEKGLFDKLGRKK
jgi:hypothetical protein